MSPPLTDAPSPVMPAQAGIHDFSQAAMFRHESKPKSPGVKTEKFEETEPVGISKPVMNHKGERRIYDLEEIIDGITPENRHHEIDFSKPLGKERW